MLHMLWSGEVLAIDAMARRQRGSWLALCFIPYRLEHRSLGVLGVCVCAKFNVAFGRAAGQGCGRTSLTASWR